MEQSKKRNLSMHGIVDVVMTGLAVATLIGFLGGIWWVFDLFSHFRVQYMQISLVLLGIAIWKRLNRRALALVLLILLNYAFILPLYFNKPDAAAEQPVRAMLINLNASNGHADRVLAAIRTFDPDLLLLEEVTPEWIDKLEELDSDYRHRVAEPQAGCFGIMLLSRHPLVNGSVLDIGDAGVPSITADIYLPQGEISLIGTHPVPPVGAAGYRQRNSQLAALPAVVASREHPVVLLGDLNTTPWSPHFSRLVRDSGLKNSMQGFGTQPTWPTEIPFLRIPLDHMLHSPEITVHGRITGKDIGSDHRPVIVDFSLRHD